MDRDNFSLLKIASVLVLIALVKSNSSSNDSFIKSTMPNVNSRDLKPYMPNVSPHALKPYMPNVSPYNRHMQSFMQYDKYFSDVNIDNPEFVSIMKNAKNGIINGFDDGTFRPEIPITKKEFVKAIFLTMNLRYEIPDKPTFADVSEDNPYYLYIETTKKYMQGSDKQGKYFNGDEFISIAKATDAILQIRSSICSTSGDLSGFDEFLSKQNLKQILPLTRGRTCVLMEMVDFFAEQKAYLKEV